MSLCSNHYCCIFSQAEDIATAISGAAEGGVCLLCCAIDRAWILNKRILKAASLFKRHLSINPVSLKSEGANHSGIFVHKHKHVTSLTSP